MHGISVDMHGLFHIVSRRFTAITELLITPRDVSRRFLPSCMQCRPGLAMRKLSVYLSLCLSVKRVDCDKTEERSVQIFIPYER